MKPPLKTNIIRYRLAIFACSMALLVIGSFIWHPTLNWMWLLIILLTAALFNIPLHLAVDEMSLVQVMTLAGGLFYGPVMAGWASSLGVGLGYGIQRLRQGKHAEINLQLDALYSIALQVLPLFVAFVIPGWTEGLANNPNMLDRVWPGVLLPMVLFILLHSGLFWVDYYLRRLKEEIQIFNSLFSVIFIELLPLLLVIVIVVAYPLMDVGAPLILGGLLVLIAIIINAIRTARTGLERRFQELSTLNQISRALSSSLDLEKLLPVIHEQVTQLLGVNNFYVALYDPNEQRIWYPLSVKHGKRSPWAPRPMAPDRLTDRVIQSGKPILLTPSTREELERVGFPSSEESPKAWMGVPLITPERTIGCLAVFSVQSTAEFTQNDLNLLTTLSGQVSVAIENALLYDQATHRAAELETLNRINTLITASLDPQEVFAQVCRSVAQVGGGQHSAIFLMDPEKGEVSLAHVFGLSEKFSDLNKSFSVTNTGRMRCLRIGRPLLMTNLNIFPLDIDYQNSLEQENIQAFGEFPLVTPDGRIGFLAVYFDAPHTFRPEEVELLQTFASQAALAVSNARLYANVDMALSRRAYQLSILETVGRELSAAIQSERLFELILNYAIEFTNSQWGDISLYNAATRTLAVRALRGYSVDQMIYPATEGLAGKVVTTQQIVNVGDIKTDPLYVDRTGSGAVRSKLCVPLIHEGRVLGVLSLESERPFAYSSTDQAFISQLATQAAISVVNAELFSETQRRLREQSILYFISTQLMGNPGAEMVLQTLARAVEAALQTTSVAIYLWDERTALYISQFTMGAAKETGCNLPEVIPYADLESIRSALDKTGPLRLGPSRGQELLGKCPDCQALIFPMIANKQRLGMVLVHVINTRTVTDDDLQLIKAIVAQVSLSLQNALLFKDVSNGRDRMAAIMDSVGEGILMVENNGRIMLANEFIQTITKLPYDKLVNNPFTFLPDEALKALGYTLADAEAIVDGLKQGIVEQSPKLILKSGTKPERVFERSTSPVWGEDERVTGWMIMLRDVTEQYQIDQARELITGTLIHDLRSPVSTALSAIEIVQDALVVEKHDEIIDQALKVARNGATRVLGLIESLLDIARMQSGRMELNLSPIDLHSLVVNILADLAPQAKEYNLNLHNEVPVGFLPLQADQNKISRVLTNILDNALKFTPSGGHVTISATIGEREDAIIRISDTGSGIPAEFREKIFDQFTQIPGQRSRRRGSGLGLTFCRMAVEAHGGRIWVEGRPESEPGSVFTFTLPLAGPKKT